MKKVYALIRNTDMTEGRGMRYEWIAFEDYNSAEEIAKGNGVFGDDCSISEVDERNVECLIFKDVAHLKAEMQNVPLLTDRQSFLLNNRNSLGGNVNHLLEGLKIKITSGDKDWVGCECTIKDVDNTGKCRVVSFAGDSYESNISKIQLNPKGDTKHFDMIAISAPTEFYKFVEKKSKFAMSQLIAASLFNQGIKEESLHQLFFQNNPNCHMSIGIRNNLYNAMQDIVQRRVKIEETPII